MFVQNQKSVYQHMNSIRNINNEKSYAEESKHFRSNIWDKEKENERNAEWSKELRTEKDNMKKNDVNITEMIKEQVKKILNRTSQGLDGVQDYCRKKLTTLHAPVAKQMYKITSNREDVPNWMTLGKTVLCQKDHS